MEPCYLVSVGLDIFQNPEHRAVSFMCNCRDSVEMKCAAAMERDANSLRILKYYDHMSKVPRLKVLLRCCERNKNMRLVLDDVIKDVMEARCTDNATACRTPKQRLSKTEQKGQD